MALYVVSDIHGQYDLYLKMLEKIGFNDKDTLFIAGDMIDRGPASIELVEDIMSRKNIISIIGNHELFMIDNLERHPAGSFWTSKGNGGTKTKEAFLKLPEDRQEKIMDFIKNLYLQYEITVGDRKVLIHHSYFIPEENTVKARDFNHKTVFDCVWNSPWRTWEYADKNEYTKDNRLHIIGHVPVQAIDIMEWGIKEETHGWTGYVKPEMPCAFEDKKNNIVNIDLGCAILGKKLSKELLEEYKPCLCCMDITAYVEGKENAFVYIDFQ